jgi:hypothetical protein
MEETHGGTYSGVSPGERVGTIFQISDGQDTNHIHEPHIHKQIVQRQIHFFEVLCVRKAN